MASLASCLKKLGISSAEGRRIRNMMAEYGQQGVMGDDALHRSMGDLIKQARTDREGILQQVHAGLDEQTRAKVFGAQAEPQVATTPKVSPENVTKPQQMPTTTEGLSQPEPIKTATTETPVGPPTVGAVQDIIDGKREAKIGTAEFKKKMLEELGRVKTKNVGNVNSVTNPVTIKIPGDGEFVLHPGADLDQITKAVSKLNDKATPDRYGFDNYGNRVIRPEYKQSGPSAPGLKEGLEQGIVTFTPNKGPSERMAGLSPDHVRAVFTKVFGKEGEKGGRSVVNTFGTPEIVLRGRGIVEPFENAKVAMETQRKQISDQLTNIFGSIVDNPRARAGWFGRLDNPDLTLKGKQLELRNFLDELRLQVNKHRVARGQAEIPYRKGYITHIIEQNKAVAAIFQDIKLPKTLRHLVEKEDVFKGGKLPKTRKFPFEKRTGAKGYKRDVVEAVSAYVDASLKDIYFGDALYKAIPQVEKLNKFGDRPIISKRIVKNSEGQPVEMHFYNLGDAPFFSERRYAEEFIKRQLGWPTNLERNIHGAIGLTPSAQRTISQGGTGMFYRSMLGAALDTGVKNLTQGINTAAELGILPTLRGYAKLATREGARLARREHLLEEFEPLLTVGDKNIIKGAAKKFDNIVLAGPMRFSEFVNRGAAYHAAFDEALRKGMSLENAELFARQAVRKTQFAYGKMDTSPFIQGAATRPLFQFFSFPIKQSELMYQWAFKEGSAGRGKLFRYLAMSGALVTGGYYVGVNLGDIFLNPFKAVDPNSKEGFNLPGSDKRVAASWGSFAQSGFAPKGLSPVISVPITIGKGLMSEDPYAKRAAKRSLITSFAPGGRYGTKVYDVYKELTGQDPVDARGRLLRRADATEAILKLVGLHRTQNEVDQSKRDAIVKTENEYMQMRQQFIDAALAGDTEATDKIIAKMQKEHPLLLMHMIDTIDKGIESEAEKKNMTRDERFMNTELRRLILSEMSK